MGTLNIGDTVLHRSRLELGEGEILKIHENKTCDVKFNSGKFSGISLLSIGSVIDIKNEILKKEQQKVLEENRKAFEKFEKERETERQKERAKQRKIENENRQKKIEEERQRRVIEQIEIEKRIRKEKEIQRPKLIKEFIEKKQINTLVHFTRIENIPSILEHGLVSVEYALKNFIDVINSDKERHDHQLDAISLSISFPNYKMFYSKQNEDKNGIWGVLILKPEILFEKKCTFYAKNAASYTDHREHDEISYLEEMFEEISNSNFNFRMLLNIPTYYTTDPQSEVLVHDKIEPKYIRKVVLKDYKSIEHYARMTKENQLNSNFFTQDSTYFKPRHDWKYWKKNQNQSISIPSSDFFDDEIPF